MDGKDISLAELPTTKALRSGETVLADEIVIHLPDGRAVHTLVNARPIYGEDGEIMSVVATLQDITPLEELKRQRATFLSRVSLELRTPLTSIKGSAATILNSSHPLETSELRQFLRIIDEQAGHMRHLVSNLVDMTQIESGTLSVTPEPMDVEELVTEASEAFVGEGVAVHVEVELAPDLPRVMANRQRMSQAIGILLKCASEHNQTIRMSASLEDLYVAVTVESAGGGLPADRSQDRSPTGSRGPEASTR